MAKRRTYASQKRMKILTQLASGKSEKSQGGKKEDTFGMDESDWNVYKEISKDGGESESEEEREKLGEVEALLMHHDPEFQKEMAELVQPSNVLTDIEEYYKLYVGVERVRVPELLFQPWMIGSEQAGLAETVELVLAQYAPDDQDRLAQNVFLTGGPAMHRGFLERMERELQMMRPFQSKFRVVRAADAVLDAWKGARLCSQQPGYLAAHAVTREEYDERGGEYMKEHHASNLYRNSINPAS
ncbi:PREDICTED: actin-related protein 5-like [Priapulus caudatus]|uniref:Actin-related protein 5-like n=1 Tax=Priapulus caudatus TaxID=37621 RepID=A0ABM1EVU4_PRICU|nr:PREDICTED: actin-related protein 5-like [Priapulus caudatus]